MMSKIENLLDLNYPPLAIFYSQEAPIEAKERHPLCSMMLVAEAAKGETVAMTLGSCRCPGASHGFGLERLDADNFPGGRDCWYRFLSIGNKDWETGQMALEKMKEYGAPKIMLKEFSEGEGFLKTTEMVREYTENSPEAKPEGPYVVIKPLNKLSGGEKPKVVAFLADPDQLSALAGIVHYSNQALDSVLIPFGAGCQCLGIYPFSESERANPRAVIGLTDISARYYLRKPLGKDFLSFAVPFSLYEEMEENALESFLTRHAWNTLRKKQQVN
ncbi:MAG: DUF169 domain-containing protein [Deltaproteobacteria bacterium]|jgi:uncharacterized protein (DUF169 family)|nr:DUF169 domain-containing protein [Deltaproteobacteria bacterium]